MIFSNFNFLGLQYKILPHISLNTRNIFQIFLQQVRERVNEATVVIHSAACVQMVVRFAAVVERVDTGLEPGQQDRKKADAHQRCERKAVREENDRQQGETLEGEDEEDDVFHGETVLGIRHGVMSETFLGYVGVFKIRHGV